MRSLLQFILRYSNFLVFMSLEVVAFLLIITYSDYPKSTVLTSANKLTAFHYQTWNNITEYFSLRRTNTILADENAFLRGRLSELEQLQAEHIADSVSKSLRNIHYMPARLIHLTTNEQHNYLTLNKGIHEGIRSGMGVRNSDGAVGIVCAVSEHYALVIPIIHTKMQLSCRLKKNDYIGTVHWDGHSCTYAQLEEIASHVHPEQGDTVVTSGLATAFPAGVPVGVVEKVELGDGDIYYTIRMRLVADFKRLNYVQVIDNELADEQHTLEKEWSGLSK